MGGDVNGNINYFTSTTDGCSPWEIPFYIPTDQRSNIEQAFARVAIHDLRGKEKSVSLDTNAFEVLKYDGSIQEDFEEGSEAQQTYYKEISGILKQRLGASRVVIYHYTFRSRGAPRTNEHRDWNHREPVQDAHVDTDIPGAHNIIERVLGKEELERLMQNRIQVINVWRPLGSESITQKPLAICDYLSVDLDKDVHQFLVRGGKLHTTGLILSRNAQDAHIWYYLSHMRSDEMFVFKMADTKPDVAQFAYHTGFINENEPTPNVEQTSLEVRCLIFYDEKQ